MTEEKVIYSPFKRLPKAVRNEWVVIVPTARGKFRSITVHAAEPPDLPYKGAKVYQVVPSEGGPTLKHVPKKEKT